MRWLPHSINASRYLIAACAGGSVLAASHHIPNSSLAEGHNSSGDSRSSSSGHSSSGTTDKTKEMPVLGTAMNAVTHAAGKASRLFHGSMMVEGELMSSKKPMSPFSGQELSYERITTPFPDPYAHEPDRPSTLQLRTDCPYTAEPDMQKLLAAGYITPNELHYVRNHLPAPVIRAEDYTLTIEGPGVGQTQGHLLHSHQQQQQQQQGGIAGKLADLTVSGSRSSSLTSPDKPSASQAAAAAAEASVVGAAAHNEPAGTGLLCQEANMSRAAAAAGSSAGGSSSSSSSRVGKVEFRLADLQQRFEQHTVVATLQCAGNRRNDMRRFKEVKGGPWEAGGIGNSAWTGPWLRDVLSAAGVDVPALLQQYQQLHQHKQQQIVQSLNLGQSTGTAAVGDLAPAGSSSCSMDSSSIIQHVWFEGYDNAGPDTHFLVSIPLDKALSEAGDVMLALKMNGEDIPGQHGYPVRVVVPGHVGTRSCKWLKRIVLSAEEAPSHWQQTDYKMLPPNMDWQAKAKWQSIPAIQALPVQSAILSPVPGAQLNPDTSGCIEVSGYAWSGGGSSITRVEVTADGGKTWVSADLQEPGFKQPDGRAWGWVLWKARVPVTGFSAAGIRVGQGVNAVLGAGVHAQDRDNANDGGRGLMQVVSKHGTDGNSSAVDSKTNRPEGRDTQQPKGESDMARSTGTVQHGASEKVVVLQCKAVDSHCNSQPSDVGAIWNIRGCACNCWHTVEVTV